MSPSLNSFGSNPSVSQLVWDTDLVIPDGYGIEAASGEVGIIGDVSVSGSVSSGGSVTTDGSVTAGGAVSSGGTLTGTNAVLSGKSLLFGEIPDNASVTLAQTPTRSGNYTSSSFAITNLNANARYTVPGITFKYSLSSYSATVTFTLQARLSDGTYQDISSVDVDVPASSSATGTTNTATLPWGATALRYKITSPYNGSPQITSTLNLTLTPIPVY